MGETGGHIKGVVIIYGEWGVFLKIADAQNMHPPNNRELPFFSQLLALKFYAPPSQAPPWVNDDHSISGI